MKKKFIICLVAIILLVTVGFGAYHYATNFLVKKTLEMVSGDPTLKKELDVIISETVPDSPSPEPEKEDASADAPPKKESTPSAPKTKDGLSMDDLQPGDKEYVMSIYKRFTASEISRVSGMLSGGITAEEKQIIKSIVYAKVSSAEVSKLLAIAKKYQ